MIILTNDTALNEFEYVFESKVLHFLLFSNIKDTIIINENQWPDNFDIIRAFVWIPFVKHIHDILRSHHSSQGYQ